jgi:hypothetical protein
LKCRWQFLDFFPEGDEARFETRKDLLAVRHHRNEHAERDETPGWWYVPTESILGRV